MENLWAVGTLARGAWLDSGVLNGPVGSSVVTNTDTNYLYSHEVGYDDDGSAMTAYIESGDLEIGDGERFTLINRVLPDFNFSGDTDEASIAMTIKGSNFPLEEASSLATATITSSTTQSDIRARARHTILRVESSGAGFGWRLGGFRFGMRQDGRR